MPWNFSRIFPSHVFHISMSSIRVKLIFERPLVKSPEQCWMLVNKSACKMVRDLEYLIVKKYFVAGHTILNLYLDDFLLPSQEKIDVIRDNDVVRVIEDKDNILSNEKLKKNTKEKMRCSKKRKHEESSDSKRKIKKAKHSFDKNTATENNTDDDNTDKQSSSNDKGKPKNTKNVNKTSHNHLTPNKDSISKTKTKQKKRKNRQKKLSRDKSIVTKLNGFLGKLAGAKNHLDPTFSIQKLSETDNTGQTPTNGTKNSCGNVSDHKKGTQARTVTDKPQESNASLLAKEKSGSGTTTERNQNYSTSQTTQGNHIRFDSEDNNDNTSTVDLNVAMLPLTHPRVLSVRGVATPSPRDTPNLSPIEPSMKNSFSAEKSTNQSNNKTNEPKGGKGMTRKDSYTNRSKVMESTRIDKDVQEQESQPVTVSSVEKDYSKYPVLDGPPRVDDIVVYKMIELSQSYTPEISKYKEGKVLSYDSLTKQLKLKLTKESLEKAKGDGRVSSKFEIFENSEEEGEAVTTDQIPDEVEIQWSSMIEPRLIVA